LIRTSVEPVLEQYRPAVLSSLKFSKLTLGTVAPQFTGRFSYSSYCYRNIKKIKIACYYPYSREAFMNFLI